MLYIHNILDKLTTDCCINNWTRAAHRLLSPLSDPKGYPTDMDHIISEGWGNDYQDWQFSRCNGSWTVLVSWQLVCQYVS